MKKYLITVIIGLLLALIIVLTKETFMKNDLVSIYKDLADAFFIPGAFLVAFGGLIIASNEHTFDMITYGIRAIYNSIRREENRKLTRSYLEYRLNKDEKGKAPFLYLIFVGAGFIVVSIVFTMLFSSVFIE